jgi:F420-0:gamma-glutamyl ligase
MRKAHGIPCVVVQGLELAGDGNARELVIPEELDLFR